MLGAEDYIAMRGNAHRAKWLTLVIFLVVLGVILQLVTRIPNAQGEALISMGAHVSLLGILCVAIIICLIKAYKKIPFSMPLTGISSDYYLGDCDGD